MQEDNSEELKLVNHIEYDAYMPDAEPKRKMFSTISVSEQQHTDDAKDGGMKTVKSVADAVSSKTGTLKKA